MRSTFNIADDDESVCMMAQEFIRVHLDVSFVCSITQSGVCRCGWPVYVAYAHMGDPCICRWYIIVLL